MEHSSATERSARSFRYRNLFAASAFFVALATILVLTANASAAFSVSGFQLSPSTVQAGGHPNVNFKFTRNGNSGEDLRDLKVAYPSGLLFNPEAATTKCSPAQFNSDTCPSASYVGSVSTVVEAGSVLTTTNTVSGGIYVVSATGTDNAVLGYVFRPSFSPKVYVKQVINIENSGQTASSTNIPRTYAWWFPSIFGSTNITIKSVNATYNARSNTAKTGPYFVWNPSDCVLKVSTLTATSYQNVVSNATHSFTPSGCTNAALQPAPSVSTSLTNSAAGGFTGVTTDTTNPTADATIQRSTVKKIESQWPNGTGLNFAHAATLGTCSAAALSSDSCPASSKLGSVLAEIPFYPTAGGADSPLWPGDIYQMPPTGSQINFAVLIRGDRAMKWTVTGNWKITGSGPSAHITETFPSIGNVPWKRAKVSLLEPLFQTPAACGGPQWVTTTHFGYSGQNTTVSSSFALTCPTEPETFLVTAPPSPSPDNTIEVTVTSDQPSAEFEFSTSGAAGPYSPCSGVGTATCVTGPQPEGPATVHVRAFTGTGTDATPLAISVDIDTTPPPAPVISEPLDGSLDNDTTPTVSGTAEPGSTVEVLDGSTVVCTAVANGSGDWSCDTSVLTDGPHSLTAVATDLAGNSGPASGAVSIEVDATAPAAPEIDSPADNSYSTSDSVVLSGTAEPDSTVVVSEGASQACLDIADGSGAWTCTATALSEGPHTFSATATDTAGNTGTDSNEVTVTVDTLVPAAPVITAPADGSTTNDSSPTIAGTGESGATISVFQGVTLICTDVVDGTNNWSCDAPPLSDGPYSVTATATDAAGNTGPASASVSFTIDTAAPDTSFVSEPSDPTADTTPTWDFTSPDSSADFECSTDGGSTWFACGTGGSGSYTLSPAASVGATVTFSVRALDEAGNLDASPASGSTTITDIPTAIITVPEDSPTNDTTPEWSFTTTGGGTVDFECSLDGGTTWSACGTGVASSSFTAPAQADGTTVAFSVRATAASITGPPATASTLIDITAPDTPVITVFESSPTNDATPEWSFTATELVDFECSLDSGATWDLCGSGTASLYTALAQADGATVTFSVRALDAAGNPSGAASASTLIDLSNPAAPVISSPTDGSSTNNPSVVVSGSAESGTTVTVYDGASPVCTDVADGGGSWDCPATLSEATHSLTATATDGAGNTSPASAAVSVTVDVTAPETTIDSVPADLTNDTEPSWSFSSNESATFECSTDGGSSWVACNSGSYTLSPAASNGDLVSFSVRATDAASNTDTTPATDSTTIDTVAPDVAFGIVPADPTSDTSPTWTFSSTDSTANFECSTDGGSMWSACGTAGSGSFTLSPDAGNGDTVELQVRATDTATNVSAPIGGTTTIDTDAPTAVITGVEPNPTNDPTPEWSFTTIGGEFVDFECSTDGGATWNSCGDNVVSSTYVSPVLPDGTVVEFAVRATDTTNLTGAPATATTTVDLTAPTVDFDSEPNNPTNDDTPDWSFSSSDTTASFECSIDGGSTWSGCGSAGSGSYSATSQSHGSSLTLAVRATDAASNTGPTVSSSTTVDLIAPSVDFDSEPDNPTNNPTPDWTFSSTDASASFECSIDGGSTWSACGSGGTGSYSAPALVHGTTVVLQVRATDTATNTGPVNSSSTTIDLVAPEVTIDLFPSDPTADAEPDWSFSSSLEVLSIDFECSTDGGSTWSGCGSGSTGSFTAPAQAHGTTVTLLVRATDAAGNTGPVASSSTTIDLVAPDVAFDLFPSDPTADAEPDWTFSSTDALASFECSTDAGVSWSTCGSGGAGGFTLSPPASNGDTVTLQVRATDPAGNTSPPISDSTTIDTDAPTAIITSAEPNPTNNPTPQWSYTTVSAEVVDFECSIDGGVSYVLCGDDVVSGTFVAPVQADGATVDFRVRAVDSLTGPDATASTTVDLTAPTVDFGMLPMNPTNDPTPTWTFSSTDVTASFECSIDGGSTWDACGSGGTGSYTASVQAHGTVLTLHVRATDAATNTGPVASTSTTIDLVAPSVVFDSVPADPTNDPSPTWTFHLTESGFSDCSIDGGVTWSSCSGGTFTAPAQLHGTTVTLQVRPFDSSGNNGPIASDSTTIDLVAPTVDFDTEPDDPTNDDTPDWTFSSTDATASFQCSIDGGSTWSGCGTGGTGSYTATAQAHGTTLTLQVRATDVATNSGPVASSSTTIDLVAPDVSFGIVPADPTSDTEPDWTFSSTDSTASFECSTDSGSTWNACGTGGAGSFTLSPAASNGDTVTLQVRATDPAGNTAAPVSDSTTIDTDAPTAIITTAEPNPTNNATPQWSYTTVSAEVVDFECSVDGGATYVPCGDDVVASTFTAPSQSDGTTVDFRVRATDAQSNTGAPASATTVIDLVAPSTSFTDVPANPTSDDTPEWSFVSDDPTATFECSLDGGTNWSTCGGTGSGTYTLSPPASNGDTVSLQVRALDAATNVDATPVSNSTTIDTAVPAAPTITNPTEAASVPSPVTIDGTTEAGATVTVYDASDDSVICTDVADGSGNWACAPVALADGDYDIYAIAVDTATNASAPSSPDRAFSVGVPPPPLDTRLLTGPNGTGTTGLPISNPTPQFTFGSPTHPSASFECQLDSTSGTWTPCTSPVDSTQMSELDFDIDDDGVIKEDPFFDGNDPGFDSDNETGDHTLYIRALDGATPDATPATAHFFVGEFKPSFTVTPSTEQAGQHPDLDIAIDNPAGDAANVTVDVPNYAWGSRLAITGSNLCSVAIATTTGACPASSLVGEGQVAVDAARIPTGCTESSPSLADWSCTSGAVSDPVDVPPHSLTLPAKVYLTEDLDGGSPGDTDPEAQWAIGVVEAQDVPAYSSIPGGGNYGTVIVKLRLNLKTNIDPNNVADHKGLTATVEDVPRTTSGPSGTAEFHVRSLTGTLYGNADHYEAPLLYNPSLCDSDDDIAGVQPFTWVAQVTSRDNAAVPDPTPQYDNSITGCDEVPFAPSLDEITLSTYNFADGGEGTPNGITAHIETTVPPSSATAKQIVVNLPPSIKQKDTALTYKCQRYGVDGPAPNFHFGRQYGVTGIDPKPTCAQVTEAGSAQVWTPLIGSPLTGKLYVESTGAAVPNIYGVVQNPDLGLDVRIRAGAVAVSPAGGKSFIRTVINAESTGAQANLPSVPIEKVVLDITGSNAPAGLIECNNDGNVDGFGDPVYNDPCPAGLGPALEIAGGCVTEDAGGGYADSWTGTRIKLIGPRMEFTGCPEANAANLNDRPPVIKQIVGGAAAVPCGPTATPILPCGSPAISDIPNGGARSGEITSSPTTTFTFEKYYKNLNSPSGSSVKRQNIWLECSYDNQAWELCSTGDTNRGNAVNLASGGSSNDNILNCQEETLLRGTYTVPAPPTPEAIRKFSVRTRLATYGTAGVSCNSPAPTNAAGRTGSGSTATGEPSIIAGGGSSMGFVNERSWKVDTSVPTNTTIVAGPTLRGPNGIEQENVWAGAPTVEPLDGASVPGGKPYFLFKSDELTSYFQCRVSGDGGATWLDDVGGNDGWTKCASGFQWRTDTPFNERVGLTRDTDNDGVREPNEAGYPAGSYELQVRAWDEINEDPTPATITFDVP